ncbi:1745_t:CDS:2 [Diversispora eburnea]|uniref:1745_t:CDS:1 n=1 Tax=Diversispora eburnea TaxID=1213867 RepID=A0A9N8Z7R9_9GLOM|nr:1745_t:CDS:2 [Diversispora eburnea]
MNILPHKSYHVYNLKNKERVRKDEEKAQQEEAAKNERKEIAERERRLKLLREKASAKQSILIQGMQGIQGSANNPFALETTKNDDQRLQIQSSTETTSGHINFWEDKEKLTIFIDPKPWYMKVNKEERYSIDGTIKKKKDEGIKSFEDPLLTLKKTLDKKKKNDVIAQLQESNSLLTIEELRAKRLAREHEERLRTLKLLNPHISIEESSKNRYNSQFNPEATEAAHNISGKQRKDYYRSNHNHHHHHSSRHNRYNPY